MLRHSKRVCHIRLSAGTRIATVETWFPSGYRSLVCAMGAMSPAAQTAGGVGPEQAARRLRAVKGSNDLTHPSGGNPMFVAVQPAARGRPGMEPIVKRLNEGLNCRTVCDRTVRSSSFLCSGKGRPENSGGDQNWRG